MQQQDLGDENSSFNFGTVGNIWIFLEIKVSEANRSHSNSSFIAFGKWVLIWERFNKCVKVQKSTNVHIVLSKIHACKNVIQ